MRRALLSVLVVALVLGAVPRAQAKSGPEKWRETGTVERILDGDTFDMITAAGTRQRVRVIGIQAPERKWCGGKEAKEALAAALPQGTKVRLASKKASSGNAPTGVWRLKRTVYKKVSGRWVDIAPSLLQRGLVFPFPFIGETLHNNEYLQIAWNASERRTGLYSPNYCGPSKAKGQRLKLEVQATGPGEKHDANAEFVIVFNGSAKDIKLGGWMVQDTSPLNAFFFPKGSVVRANDYVVVYSGNGRNGIAPDGRRDKRSFYARTGQKWNNRTTDIAFLFDSQGKDRTGNLRDWLVISPKRG